MEFKGNQSNLTKEQLDRFNMPHNEIIGEHWNQIPEIFIVANPSEAPAEEEGYSNWISNFFSEIFNFVGSIGVAVGGAVTGIVSNVTAILIGFTILLMLLVLAWKLVRWMTTLLMSPKYSRICGHKSRKQNSVGKFELQP